MNIKFDELNVLQKYFHNRVGYTEFLEAMSTVYGDENYISPLWLDFKKNPILFLTSRTEVNVFQFFIDKIKSTGYKG